MWQLGREGGTRSPDEMARSGMPLVTDRALWESILDADAEVPPGRTAGELLPSLLDLLGEHDPSCATRSATACSPAGSSRTTCSTADDLRYAVDRLVPDLRLGLDGSDDGEPTACRAPLVLGAGAGHPRLPRRRGPLPRFPPTSTSCSTPAVEYLLDEPDRRGTSPELGWINATAHAADLLKFLVRNPQTDSR